MTGEIVDLILAYQAAFWVGAISFLLPLWILKRWIYD